MTRSPSPNEFAQTLTVDLRSVYNDMHLGIQFNPQLEKIYHWIPPPRGRAEELRKENARRGGASELRVQKRVEILNGNIGGYLSFDMASLASTTTRRATVNSAFAFLKSVNAPLISIDLRHNGG